jgi:hypothetical protein
MATLQIEPVVKTSRTEEEIDRALLTVAMCGGNQKRAIAQLAAAGFEELPPSTLSDWVTTRFPERYQALCLKYGPEIERRMITGLRRVAARSFEIAGEAIELEYTRLAAGDVKDAAASSRNLATTGGIMTDKMLLLDGRPTAIHEQRSAEDVLRALDAMGFIEGTATEEVT